MDRCSAGRGSKRDSDKDNVGQTKEMKEKRRSLFADRFHCLNGIYDNLATCRRELWQQGEVVCDISREMIAWKSERKYLKPKWALPWGSYPICEVAFKTTLDRRKGK